MPPSTEIVWPVMYVEPGMQRKATIEDISSGSPARLSGAWLKILSLNSLFEKTYTNKEKQNKSWPHVFSSRYCRSCVTVWREHMHVGYEKKMNSAYSYKTTNFTYRYSLAIDLALGSRKKFRTSETRFSPFWILHN